MAGGCSGPHTHTHTRTHTRGDTQTRKQADTQKRRQTDRQTERQPGSQTDTEAHRPTDAQAHHRDTQTSKHHTHTHADTLTRSHADTQTHRHTDTQAFRPTETQRHRDTRQTNAETHTHTNTETQRHRHADTPTLSKHDAGARIRTHWQRRKQGALPARPRGHASTGRATAGAAARCGRHDVGASRGRSERAGASAAGPGFLLACGRLAHLPCLPGAGVLNFPIPFDAPELTHPTIDMRTRMQPWPAVPAGLDRAGRNPSRFAD